MATQSTTTVPHTSRGPILIIVSNILLGLNVIFIGLRFYTKARIAKTFNYNDVFMMIAVAAYASLDALLILGIKNGIGRHTSSATITGVGNSLKFIFFLEIIYVLLTSVMKASIAITLLQWAKKKIHIYILWAAIALDAAICMAIVLFFLLQCAPISYTWEFINPAVKGHCAPETTQILMGFALCAVTVSIDMIYLFIPFFMLKDRGVNSRLKLYIYSIFGLGVLASIANFLRLAALAKFKKTTDPLFDAAPIFLWSAVEVSIGLSVAGIIELRPLMRKYNVKGFEDSFEAIEEDSKPIRLQSMDKSTISFPVVQEMGGKRGGENKF